MTSIWQIFGKFCLVLARFWQVYDKFLANLSSVGEILVGFWLVLASVGEFFASFTVLASFVEVLTTCEFRGVLASFGEYWRFFATFFLGFCKFLRVLATFDDLLASF